jgi:hypothetical protein
MTMVKLQLLPTMMETGQASKLLFGGAMRSKKGVDGLGLRSCGVAGKKAGVRASRCGIVIAD